MMDSLPTCTLVGTVKDEGPYLLEWISYYKLIGFERVFVASNDSLDRTREILDTLDAAGEITHLENSDHIKGEPEDPQNRAYQRFWKMDEVKGSDWILVADADEFLNIHAGDGSLGALFAGLKARRSDDADVLSATWRVFGNGGVTQFEDAPIIEQFSRSAPPGVNRIQRYTGFKTMFRPRGVRRLGVHRPKYAPRFRNGLVPLKWVNGSGEEMPAQYITQGWRSFEGSYGDALVSMNHYMIKSSEAFLMKRYRGTANSADAERIDFSYFETFNANHVENVSIQRHVPALRAAIEDLKTRVPKLRDLHEESLAWHRKRLDVARAEVVADLPEIAQKLGLVA
ncbi:MAG: glycosyltransferase family 2 protein [Pseudomonadota bacterium]